MDLDKKEHQNMFQVTQQTLLSHPDFISFLCVTEEDPGYYTYYPETLSFTISHLMLKMLTKTHSIVTHTVDPFYNMFIYTFLYHSKTHSMTIMTIWTFEKGSGYNIKQL